MNLPLDFNQPTTRWGMFGGCLANLLRIVKLANVTRNDRPPTFNDPLYYIQFAILASRGGVFAFLYEKSGTHLTPVVAVNIGAAAPLIAQQAVTSVPSIGKPE